MGDGLVQARGLRKSFGDVEAVRGVDVDVAPGEIFGFLGPNGAGKSSTMRMIACVSPRSDGSLQVLGMDPDVDGPRIRARIGVVPQLDNLDTELTVRENLEVYGRYFGLSRAHVRSKAVELLEFARLADRADAAVESLSGGMKRRLTIARSLVNDPELLLLDEPTTGLDPQARHLLWDRLYRLKGEGVTQIVTTHYMDEAEQLCDRLVVMDGGVIVAEGSPAELIARYSTREVLELRFPTGTAVPAEAVERLAERVEVLPDRLLLYTADGEHLQAELARRGCGRCPRWSGARRWKTCSCGSPAGAWSTEMTDTRPSSCAAVDRPRRRPARRRAARRRAPLDLVPAQLARHRRLVDPAAAAVPARLRRRVRHAHRRHGPGGAGHRRPRLPRVARAGPAVRLGGADGGVRLDVSGALRLQVAAPLPRHDGHPDRPRPGRRRAPRLDDDQDRRLRCDLRGGDRGLRGRAVGR